GKGRLDESGDFTKGAELNEKQMEAIGLYLGFVLIKKENESYLEYWEELADDWRGVVGDSRIGAEGISELLEIGHLVSAAGYDDGRINIDPSVVRGLEYYTGPVFESELTFPVVNEDGETVRFGSVGGGGRYDGLVSRFRGEPVPATGFSIGVSRLMTALKNL